MILLVLMFVFVKVEINQRCNYYFMKDGPRLTIHARLVLSLSHTDRMTFDLQADSYLSDIRNLRDFENQFHKLSYRRD